jgi:type IX secretion system PorP/SprF family membrane protein
MVIRFVTLSLIFSCWLTSHLVAQDIHFSQFGLTPLIQNPALAGTHDKIRANINYRDQWRSVATPYATVQASADMALTRITNQSGFWAAGFNLFHDKAGESEMSSFQGNLSVAYHVYCNDHSTLGAGITGGFAQRSVNFDQLQWGSQFDGYAYDPSLLPGDVQGSEKTTYSDLGAGVVWNYIRGEKYLTGNDHLHATFGVAVLHPHRPAYSFNDANEKLQVKWVAHGQTLIGISNSSWSLKPGFIFYQQGKSSEITAGSMFRFMLSDESNYTGFEQGKAISAGIHYRFNDALIASLNLELGRWEIGMSYDINLSSLDVASSGRGGFEIGIGFMMDNPRRVAAAKRY